MDILKWPTDKYRRFIKFTLVGASGVGVDEGTAYILLYIAGLKPLELVLTLSAATAIFTNFVLNDIFTFRDRRLPGLKTWLSRLFKFYVFCLAGVGIKVVVASLLYNTMNLPELLANLFGIVVAMMWNFLLNNRWTWKARESG